MADARIFFNLFSKPKRLVEPIKVCKNDQFDSLMVRTGFNIHNEFVNDALGAFESLASSSQVDKRITCVMVAGCGSLSDQN